MVRKARHPDRLAVAREDRERDIVEDAERVEQAHDLETAGDPRLDPLGHRHEGDVLVLEEDLAAVRLQMRADQIDERRLARSVRAYQREEFAGVHDEIEAVASSRFAELLTQVDCPQ